jgi:hypothetical protein
MIDLPDFLPYRSLDNEPNSEIPRTLLMRLTVAELHALFHHIASRVQQPAQLRSKANKNAIINAITELASSAGQTVARLFPKYPKLGSILMQRDIVSGTPQKHRIYRFARVEAIEMYGRHLGIKLKLIGWRAHSFRTVAAAPREPREGPITRNGHDVDGHNTEYVYGIPLESAPPLDRPPHYHVEYAETEITLDGTGFQIGSKTLPWEQYNFLPKPVKYMASFRKGHRCTTKKCAETRRRLMVVAELSRRLPTELTKKIMSTVNRRQH